MLLSLSDAFLNYRTSIRICKISIRVVPLGRSRIQVKSWPLLCIGIVLHWRFQLAERPSVWIWKRESRIFSKGKFLWNYVPPPFHLNTVVTIFLSFLSFDDLLSPSSLKPCCWYNQPLNGTGSTLPTVVPIELRFGNCSHSVMQTVPYY